MPTSKLERVIEIIFYILLIWFAIQIILKITGNSPSIEAMLITGLSLVISYLRLSTFKFAQFMGQTYEFMDNSKQSFNRIRNDMDKIKEKLKI